MTQLQENLDRTWNYYRKIQKNSMCREQRIFLCVQSLCTNPPSEYSQVKVVWSTLEGLQHMVRYHEMHSGVFSAL